MNSLFGLIYFYSLVYGIDYNLALSVAYTESGFNTNQIGLAGEIGAMQILPQYSKYTKKQLFDPRINVKEGIRKLVEAKKYCKHKLHNSWVVCYNIGVTGANKIKNPYTQKYYRKVMEKMEEFKWDQRVAVIDLYNKNVPGYGICKGRVRNSDKYRVEVDGMILHIEPCRLRDEEDFFEELRKQNEKI